MKRFSFNRTLGYGALAGVGLLLCLATAQPPLAQPPQPSEKAVLTVRVLGVRNVKGRIGAALFNGAEGYPMHPEKAFRRTEANIDTAALDAEVVFKDLSPGVYAVSMCHDENLNGKLDKNFLGIPKEGYGVSNNPKKRKRAPTFDEAKFTLAESETIEIRLIY